MPSFAFNSDVVVVGDPFRAVGLSFNFNVDPEGLDHRLGALMQVQKVIVAKLRSDDHLSVKTTSIISEDIGSFGSMIAKRVGMPGITILVSCPRMNRQRDDVWVIGWELKIAETVAVNRERAGHITSHAAAMVATALLDESKVPELGFATMRVAGVNRTSDEANEIVSSYTVAGTVDVMLKKQKIRS